MVRRNKAEKKENYSDKYDLYTFDFCVSVNT
jgi:hypothetical protein